MKFLVVVIVAFVVSVNAVKVLRDDFKDLNVTSCHLWTMPLFGFYTYDVPCLEKLYTAGK